jgi:hypothetical protein
MNEIDWEYIKESLKAILSLVDSKLEKSLIDHIEHYIKHDEYEMAFEVLFTEIIKFENLSLIDYKKVKEIGKLLKLDKETVFDPNFWGNFISFIKKIEPDRSDI